MVSYKIQVDGSCAQVETSCFIFQRIIWYPLDFSKVHCYGTQDRHILFIRNVYYGHWVVSAGQPHCLYVSSWVVCVPFLVQNLEDPCWNFTPGCMVLLTPLLKDLGNYQPLIPEPQRVNGNRHLRVITTDMRMGRANGEQLTVLWSFDFRGIYVVNSFSEWRV